MPTIDISLDYVVWDNTQQVTITNPNNSSTTVEYALQQGIDTVLADMGDGTLGYRTFCVWNVWREPLFIATSILYEPTSGSALTLDPQGTLISYGFFIPQLNSKITDKYGVNWFVSAVNLDAWGEKYQLECEAQAGTPVLMVDLPGNS